MFQLNLRGYKVTNLILFVLLPVLLYAAAITFMANGQWLCAICAFLLARWGSNRYPSERLEGGGAYSVVYHKAPIPILSELFYSSVTTYTPEITEGNGTRYRYTKCLTIYVLIIFSVSIMYGWKKYSQETESKAGQ
jgi:hypothetical protein